jgi:hypothetical protein
MITVPFPLYIDSTIEKSIYKWMDEMDLDKHTIHIGTNISTIEFEDEEDAIAFRLRFGL